MDNETYTHRRTGTTGCEIIDPNGTIVAWTPNEMWAAVIAHALNNNDHPGVSVAPGLAAQAACCCMGADNRTNDY